MGLIHYVGWWNTIHCSVCCWIPAHEGEPLQHEGAGLLHTSSVRAPVLQAEVGEIPEDVQSLTGRDVPVSALLYFGEDPRLNESASEENKNQTYDSEMCSTSSGRDSMWTYYPLSYCKSKKAHEIHCWLCTTETPHKKQLNHNYTGCNEAIELKLTAK